MSGAALSPPGPLRPPAGPGLYVHVPFCVGKCAYCDFASEAPPRPERLARYLEMLERELALLHWDRPPATIYIGGGTPTALPPAALERLLELVRGHARAAEEWTVEANPGTVDLATARRLRAAGVTRVSLGAQTFHEPALRALGRRQLAADIPASVRALRRAGIEHVALDLMLAIPQRPRDALERDLDELLALDPEHVSAYLLSIEAGTPLAAAVARGELAPPADEEAVAEYERVHERLVAAGFRHYEISNWARPGRECRHNLLYWTGGEYRGVGPAAHSHWGGLRWGNFQSLDEWAQRLSKGWTPAAFEERLPPERAARERLVMWLRLVEGVPTEDFRVATGHTPEEVAGEEIRSLLERGLLERTPAGLRLSARALLISNVVFAELV
ncbi:MAG: radical SAM family heme chaperone HemW [Kiritimatiellae bacterium]|nr:radical SAM family heme chaperone HemW [Kiritimatiellia bacterium]